MEIAVTLGDETILSGDSDRELVKVVGTVMEFMEKRKVKTFAVEVIGRWATDADGAQESGSVDQG